MRKILIVAAAILITIGSLYTWYRMPRTVSLSINAMEYRLGDSNPDYAKPVKVVLSGELSRNWKGLLRFEGFVEVEDANISVPPEQRKLDLLFDRSRMAYLRYVTIKDGGFIFDMYGSLHVSKDLGKIAIAKMSSHKDGDKQAEKGWSSGDGYMIAGPASSRQEALAISNELMEPELVGIRLE